MRHEPSREAPSSAGDAGEAYEPVRLYRTFGWTFLPPAMAALACGAVGMLGWFEPNTGIILSIFFVGALLFSPEKAHLDWYGLCFSTASAALFVIGHPVSYALSGLAALFAILTAFDEYSGLRGKERAVLLALFVLTASLVWIAYAIAPWATFGLGLAYLFLHLSVRLLPIGLAAKASLLEDEES